MSARDDGAVHLRAAFQRDRDSLPWTVAWPSGLRTGLRASLAGDDVVSQHGGELGLVLGLQQVVDRSGGQSREGRVRRREDGERARALSVSKAGGLHGGTSVLNVPAPTAVSTMSASCAKAGRS